MDTIQVHQFSFCTVTNFTALPIQLLELPAVLEIILGALMCLLTAIQLVQELLRMYKATKHVKLNCYIECLVWEGMIYFIVYVHILSYCGSSFALSLS